MSVPLQPENQYVYLKRLLGIKKRLWFKAKLYGVVRQIIPFRLNVNGINLSSQKENKIGMVLLMKIIVFPVCFCCHVSNIKKQPLKGLVKLGVVFFGFFFWLFFFAGRQNEQ